MTTVGPKSGTCPVCSQTILVVNHRPATERQSEVGYLARHGRPGLRRDYNCRGSFGSWVEKVTRPIVRRAARDPFFSGQPAA